MPLPIRPPGGSGNAKSLRVSDIADFRGGLNLSDDLSKLAENESPDMLNLDAHARGGLVLRGGMRSRSDSYTGTFVHSDVFRFQSSAGDETQVVVALTDDGGVVPHVDVSGAGSVSGSLSFPVDRPSADDGFTTAQMNDQAVFISKRYRLRRGVWNGTVLDWSGALGVAGTGGWDASDTLPTATLSAVWDNRLWVANTLEDGADYRNRVRWSNDGNPTQWTEDDWIDIDIGEDGDAITALAVHGEILVVFKNRAVYAVLPDETTLYRVVPIAAAVGATGQHAVVSTPFGLMFWDGQSGLHGWQSQQPTPIGQKIVQAIHEERIPFDAGVCLSWVNDRVWVTVDLDGARCVLVYDPRLGAWTRYDQSVEVIHRVNQERWGFSGTAGRWLAVDLRDEFDDLGDGTVPIAAYWVSPWLHGGSKITPKRWRRPRFILGSTNGGELDIQVRADLDPRRDVRQFDLELPARVSGSSWGGSTWGGTVWGGDSEEYAELLQGPAIGNFKSIQVRVDGPSNVLSRWRMDGMAATFKPKVIRS